MLHKKRKTKPSELQRLCKDVLHNEGGIRLLKTLWAEATLGIAGEPDETAMRQKQGQLKLLAGLIRLSEINPTDITEDITNG